MSLEKSEYSYNFLTQVTLVVYTSTSTEYSIVDLEPMPLY